MGRGGYFTVQEKIEAVLWMHAPLTATEVANRIEDVSRATASAVIKKALDAGNLVEVDFNGPRGGRRVNLNPKGKRFTPENQILWDELAALMERSDTLPEGEKLLTRRQVWVLQAKKRKEAEEQKRADEAAKRAAKNEKLLEKKPHLDATPIEGEFDFGF